jgi:hypothetical protein
LDIGLFTDSKLGTTKHTQRHENKIGLSLAPGFSPVWNRRERTSRFNGFSAITEAAEAAEPPDRHESPG